MANVFDQFDEKRNVFDQFDGSAVSQQRIELPQLNFAEMARKGIVMPAVPGMQPMLPDADITGASRATPQTRALPELQESGILSGEDQSLAATLSPVLLATTNPNEIAKIITSNFPNVGVTYNTDAQGGVYPVLVNNKTGAVAQINRPGLSGLDVLQAIGIGAALTPAGKAGTALGAGGKAAATQSAIESAQTLAGGDFSVPEVALAGVTGGVFRGQPPSRQGVPSSIIPENEIVSAGRQAGIPVMTSDVLPPKTFPGRALQQTAEKIPIAGTAGMRQEQQAMRQEAVQRVADQYGEFSYESIVGSLKQTKDKVKKAAGNVIEQTGEKIDQAGEIPLDNTLQAIQSVRDELSKPGVLRTGTGIEDIDRLLGAITESPQTFTSLKENRTAFRNIVDSIDPTSRSQLTSREKGLLTKVQGAMTKDMEDSARNNLTPVEFAKWKRANAIYADEAKKLTRTKLKGILDKGDITPESVKGMLFSRNPSEVRILHNSLSVDGKRNARSAIISKAINAAADVDGNISPNRFLQEMKKVSSQVDIFFKGKDKAQIKGLVKALNATRRAQDAAITTPTGQQLIGGLSIAGLYVDPVASLGTAGTLGGLARIYESAPVRNALLRLSSAQQGTPRFERALNELQGAVSSSAQVLRSQQIKEEE